LSSLVIVGGNCPCRGKVDTRSTPTTKILPRINKGGKSCAQCCARRPGDSLSPMMRHSSNYALGLRLGRLAFASVPLRHGPGVLWRQPEVSGRPGEGSRDAASALLAPTGPCSAGEVGCSRPRQNHNWPKSETSELGSWGAPKRSVA